MLPAPLVLVARPMHSSAARQRALADAVREWRM